MDVGAFLATSPGGNSASPIFSQHRKRLFSYVSYNFLLPYITLYLILSYIFITLYLHTIMFDFLIAQLYPVPLLL